MITLCENCHHSIFPPVGGDYWEHHGPRGGTSTATTDCFQKDPRVPASAVATFGVEAWETDEPAIVIVGTHDRILALKAATKLYMDLNGELPDALTHAVEDATLFWVNRDDPAYRTEHWPAGVTSNEERDTDTPALRHTW